MKSPIRKIMTYIDGSEESMTAARLAIVVAASLGAELHALYVVNTRALHELVKARIFLESEQAEYLRDLEVDAARYLDEARDLARRKGLALTLERASGAVNVEIRNKVVERGIDLLVLGEVSRIRSRRDEFFDETERAMRSVPCSVIIAKDGDRIQELYDSLE